MWAAYVARFGEGMTQRQVGDIADVDQATVGRWLRGDKVPTEAGVVARLAQGFGRNPLEAFVAAGFLTIEEAGRGLAKEEIVLLSELAARLEMRAAEEARDKLEDEAMRIASLDLYEQHLEGAILGPKSLRDAMNDGYRAVGLPESRHLSSPDHAESLIRNMLLMAKLDLKDRHPGSPARDLGYYRFDDEVQAARGEDAERRRLGDD